MKLKTINKLFLFASLLCGISDTASADLFSCQPCPAGYACDGTSKSRCAGGFYSGVASSSCTYCSINHYSNAGAGACTECPKYSFNNYYRDGSNSCVDIRSAEFNSSRLDLLANLWGSDGARCVSGSIAKGGAYRVILAGGDGGNCSNDANSLGGKGGYLEYAFIAHDNGTFQICVGQKGRSSNGVNEAAQHCGYEIFHKSGAGGGGGSFLKLTFSGKDYYFVAGGGGGCLNGDDDSAGGGGGGGIGAGGAGGVGGANCDGPGLRGGDSGEYSGGAEQCPYNNQANAGSGLINGVIGASCKVGASGGGNGGKGGRSASEAPTTIFYTYGIDGPGDATNAKIGGDGGGVNHWNGYDGGTSVSSNVAVSEGRPYDGNGLARLYRYLY